MENIVNILDSILYTKEDDFMSKIIKTRYLRRFFKSEFEKNLLKFRKLGYMSRKMRSQELSDYGIEELVKYAKGNFINDSKKIKDIKRRFYLTYKYIVTFGVLANQSNIKNALEDSYLKDYYYELEKIVNVNKYLEKEGE